VLFSQYVLVINRSVLDSKLRFLDQKGLLKFSTIRIITFSVFRGYYGVVGVFGRLPNVHQEVLILEQCLQTSKGKLKGGVKDVVKSGEIVFLTGTLRFSDLGMFPFETTTFFRVGVCMKYLLEILLIPF